MSVNSGLKAVWIIVQKKAFFKKTTPEPSYAIKETVDKDILLTSKNDDRKIMQSIRRTSGPPSI